MSQAVNIDQEYRRVSKQLSDHFFPLYKLLHCSYLEKKMHCFTQKQKTDQPYEPCIEGVEAEITKNADQLRNKMNLIDQRDAQCLKRCVGKGSNCEMACVDKLQQDAKTLYASFYHDKLRTHKDYEPIK